MIAMARQKQIYDRSELAELAKMLDDEVAAGRRHALIVAADVFRSEAAVLPGTRMARDARFC